MAAHDHVVKRLWCLIAAGSLVAALPSESVAEASNRDVLGSRIEFEVAVTEQLVPVAQRQPGFLTYTLSPNDNRVTFWFDSAEAAAEFEEVPDVRSSASTTVATGVLPAPVSSLEDATRTIYELARHKVDNVVSSAALDIDEKRIILFVVGQIPHDLEQALSPLVPRSFDLVVEIQDGEEFDTACTSRTACTNPMKAGNKMVSCTMGFHVQYGSDVRFFTSGHCSWPNGSVWAYGGYPLITGPNFLSNHGVDALLVDVDNSQGSNLIYGWSSSVAMTGSRYPAQGETVCASLSFSNSTPCASVEYTYTTWTSSTCSCTQHGGKAAWSTIGGDSGSPVFTISDKKAIGINATNLGRFARVQEAIALLGWPVRTW